MFHAQQSSHKTSQTTSCAAATTWQAKFLQGSLPNQGCPIRERVILLSRLFSMNRLKLFTNLKTSSSVTVVQYDCSVFTVVYSRKVTNWTYLLTCLWLIAWNIEIHEWKIMNFTIFPKIQITFCFMSLIMTNKLGNITIAINSFI